jgi:hypothetical protein
MSANKFVLKGHGVEVDYVIGANPGFTALTFKRGTTVETFKPAQIQTDHTGLGSLVSVLVVRTVDTGGGRFGFFLPQIDVPLGQTVDFATVGVFEDFSGPDSVPHRPTSWHCVGMRGTAQTVFVPLEQPAEPASADASP